MILIHILPLSPIERAKFSLFVNNISVFEPTINCVDCGLTFHQICTLYTSGKYPKGFLCKSCMNKKVDFANYYIETKYKARNLPTSQLGNFIENHVNCFLEENDFRTALAESKTQSKIGRIIVRVTYDQTRTFSTLKGYKSWKGSTCNPSKIVSTPPSNGDLSEPGTTVNKEYSYRVKNIFCFQEVDGGEACFFGMLMHEYGSDGPKNNRYRIYISYIDSVKIFQPCTLRTRLYHEIILSYLNYSKKLGFRYAHIWSCPPGENDDYIFYRHPAQQFIPKAKMLCNWYSRMIETGKKDGIIESSSDLANYVMEEEIDDINDLPYFEGDFWPNMIEDSINQLNEAKNETDAQANEGSVKKSSKVNDASKPSKKKRSLKVKKNVSSRKTYDDTSLYGKVLNLIEKYKDIFFVVTLSSEQTDNKIVDTDKVIFTLG